MKVNIPTYEKILVHGGRFQADDVADVAILRILGISAPLYRVSSITTSDLKDPRTIVVDAGRSYEPKLGNFDHHQDENLPASCLLLWDYFFPELNEEDREVKQYIRKVLLEKISDTDKGIKDGNNSLYSISSIIGSFNHVENGFDKAVNVMFEILDAAIKDGLFKRKVRKEKWDGFPFIGGERKIKYIKKTVEVDSDTIKVWKLLARHDDTCFVIFPHKKGYTSMSLNGIRIPEDRRQIARRLDGRNAWYKKETDVLNHTLELVAN